MSKNRYSQLIEKIFFDNYKKGSKKVSFVRTDIENAANELGIKLPKNLGDVIYSFRFRTTLPEKITDIGKGKHQEWLIKLAGRGNYYSVLKTN